MARFFRWITYINHLAFFWLTVCGIEAACLTHGSANGYAREIHNTPSQNNHSSSVQPTSSKTKEALQIKSLYGTLREENDLVKAIIAHPAFVRLRQIDNAGPGRYFRSLPSYTLFDHALGVLVILNRYKQSEKEQLAGMLEPIAHSVFAHHGTLYLKPKGTKLPYYLAAQKGFLRNVGIEKLLKQAGLSSEDINPIRPEFEALKKNPPFLSVLEIEMTLRLAYSYKLLSKTDIETILRDLRFENGQWIFISKRSAERLARLSLYFTEQYWGAPQNYVINRWVAAAMRRALSLKLLSVNDIRFGTDKNILSRLTSMQDQIIKGLMTQCRQPYRFFDVSTTDQYDDVYKPEFRGLNPLVKVKEESVRLTTLDPDFKDDFDALRLKFLDGIKIKYKKARSKSNVFQNQMSSNSNGSQEEVSHSTMKSSTTSNVNWDQNAEKEKPNQKG